MRMTALVPMLQTDDIARTRSWYEEVLGFRCVSSAGEWCRLERDDIAIMFMRNDHLGPPHATATQYIYVDDIDELWESVKERCTAPGKDELWLDRVRHKGPKRVPFKFRSACPIGFDMSAMAQSGHGRVHCACPLSGLRAGNNSH